MPSTDKYCEDCRFFQPSRPGERSATDSLKFGRCGNPAAAEEPNADRFISPNLDVPEPNKYASLFREHGECGSDAKLFEAKTAE